MFLDVVVKPDRMTWRYKDEDEFADAIQAGIFTELEAQEVRDTAAQALQIIAENRRPFNNVWGTWRPDEKWTIPQIPQDWEEV
jgi:predicted RNA-binding protein associated with RNAse of E/G family